MGGLIGSNQHSKRLSAVVLRGILGGNFKTGGNPLRYKKYWRRKQSSANWSPPGGFPVPREISGKFADFGLEIAKAASAFGRKFNRLLIEFPSRLNRESLRAIREPGAGNSEPYPNNGARCLAPYHLRPQVQILG